MQPFIGVTCSADADGQPRVNPVYVRALHAAGALPVPLPFVTQASQAQALLDRLHGMVFTGSEDLDPALWGEALHPETRLMHPARMTTELLLARAVLERRTPTLGICGGMQTLNVACGGSLHQHVPDVTGLSSAAGAAAASRAGAEAAAGAGTAVAEAAHAGAVAEHEPVEHRDPSFTRRHEVRTVPGTRLGELLGACFGVNTEHHQAVHRLGAGLRAAARAPDGILEAFELAGAPFLVGVQWHPERMPDDERQHRLFSALAAAARAGRVG